MPIIEQIKADRISAMKSKDSKVSNLLAALISDIIKIGKDKRNSETTEDEAVQCLRKYIKSCQDNLSLPNLTLDHINSFKFEIEALSKYLPQQISKDELKEFILKQGSVNKKDLFKILKETCGNSFDPKLINDLIKQ